MSAAKNVKVRVLPGRRVYVHPDHVDGLRAPDAEALAEVNCRACRRWHSRSWPARD